MDVRQIRWRKWTNILLAKMFGQRLELYYLVDTTTDQLFSRTEYFILEEMEQSEL